MKDSIIDKVVKIAGTNYDRRRTLSVETVKNIRAEYASGKTLAFLANKYNVCSGTILYHVDDEYRVAHNLKRNRFAHSPAIRTTADRIAYKKSLVENL